MDLFLLIVIIFFVMASIMFMVWHNLKKSSWNGLVINKEERFDEQQHQSIYLLVFRTTQAKIITLDVDSRTYNQFEIGDRVVKYTGEFLPKHLD